MAGFKVGNPFSATCGSKWLMVFRLIPLMLSQRQLRLIGLMTPSLVPSQYSPSMPDVFNVLGVNKNHGRSVLARPHPHAAINDFIIRFGLRMTVYL